MKRAFWNLRGLNKPGRMKCLSDFVKSNNVDLIGVQETKELIPQSFLGGVDKNLSWKYVLAKGTAGGILSSLEIVSWQEFNFCGAALVKQHGDKEM
jgi:exonuclease III